MDNIFQTTPTVGERKEYNLEFRGSGSEYFRIWIVNMLLTIVTLGIYSPWAKVRKQKYFNKNTFLAGDSFDYHADPIKILIGRLIILFAFLLYSFSPLLSPIIGGIVVILFLAMIPWLIVRSAIFKWRNTSYRNIRFGFNKNYASAYESYILGGLAMIFTVYLMFPYTLYKHYSFLINNMNYGTQPITYKARLKEFFKIIYGSVLYAMILIVAISLFIFVGSIIVGKSSVLIFAAVAFIYLSFTLIYGYQKAKVANELARQTSINEITLKSDLQAIELGLLYLTNLVAIVCTLGLATPWAAVRAVRYRLEHTQVVANEEDFNQFLAHQQSGGEGNFADAATDFWDIDFGL